MENYKMEKHDFDMEKIVDQLNIDDEPRANHKDRLRWEMLKVFNSSNDATQDVKHKWRRIMNIKTIKLAVAAMILIAVVMSMTMFEKTIPMAYALQDTIEAYSSVRSLHTKSSYWKDQKEEFWVQCDNYGRIQKFRLEHLSPGGVFGSTTTVNDGNVTDYWLPKYNMRIRTAGKFSEENTYLPYGISEIDPKLAFDRLYQQQERGKVILDIVEPERKSEPIVITVTYPEGSWSENWKIILQVDQATKLVKKQEKYENQQGEYKHVRTDEYFDYNQPIDPKFFSLVEELPEDEILIDRSNKEIGLAQGDMTDKEIAIEVGKQYFEAQIAEDYEKAGLLLRGFPPDFIEKTFGKVNEITQIGLARADTRPGSRTMIASFKILAEDRGYMIEYDVESLYIEPVYGQPGRWHITGFFIRWDNPATPDTGPVKTTQDVTDLGLATYNGLVPGELMQKWLMLDPVGIKPRGQNLVPSKETIEDEYAAYHINVSQFEPTVTIGQQECTWSLIECEYGHIDFGSVKLKDELVFGGPFYSYIWSQVNMTEEKQAVLEIGSSLPLRIWLNGMLVHDRPTWQDIDNETEHVDVNFKKGNNQLVIKFVCPRGYWGFSCRLIEE
jgi:hypothetical protein